MYRCALILAAGEGKRMKSSMPKVLHKVCGKEMVNHVIDNLRKSAINDIDVIIGRGWEKVKEATLSRNVCYSLQKEQLGTGHAVLCADDFLKGKSGNVAILVGDGPLITESTINKLFDYQEKGNFKCTILTTKLDNPAKYGRIVRNSNGEVEKIVEFKDCNEDETKINEVNSGIYAFDIDELRKVLKKVKNNNAQNEYYLTDVIEILKKDGQKVGAVDVPYTETLAVNSRVELAQVEKVMRRRINTFHMENGVTILDPEATYIGPDVTIGSDTIIYPGNVLEGNTVIGQNCVLYPNSRIFNSTIEDGVIIQCSVILEGHVGEGTTVGPCAYIRPESKIGSHVRIGDFVEIKKSTIGDNTKVSHLTYIGDAEVGKGCNFGCGTVVVNYDGKKKNKTIIGNHSFIGCNTNLVSPVTLEDNTYTAAGSTITDKVPEGNLSIARARQVNIPGWVEKKGLKK